MAPSDPPSPPPFHRLGPAGAASPLVIAVPHAGRHYPPAIETERAVARALLEGLEDRHADRLVTAAVARGAVAIVATHARAWIDLNRGEEDGGAPDSPSASFRARAGLGLVPSRAAGRLLWRGPVSEAEAALRLAETHRPYHAALAGALAEARVRHGVALLVDCHSMPPLQRPGRAAPRIVIGDLHGESADPAVATAAVAVARARGFEASRNAPYAGAFTLRRHGAPRAGVHAIQIEIDRGLYLESGLRALSEDWARTADLFADLCEAAVAALDAGPVREAAE